MTHLLIVEDDPALRRSLALTLQARGYTCDETGNGEDAVRLAGRRRPDVLLVDLGLPSMSGLEVIRAVRVFSDAPIIVLSARSAEDDKVGALDAGATDYVTKPFGVQELMARMRVAERIARLVAAPERTVVTPDFTVDLDQRVVIGSDGEPLRLTRIEWGLLAHLAATPGRLVTHRELIAAVWGPAYDPDDTNALRVHVAHLRAKLEPDPGTPRYLKTDPGIGYRFVAG
jgi:two-component system KDP operon response regulator KdpE